MKGLMYFAACFAVVFLLVWLCDVVPIVGYSLAALLVLRMFVKLKRPREVPDTEPPDHFHHH
jgi:uncharacterized membrane protein YesL